MKTTHPVHHIEQYSYVIYTYEQSLENKINRGDYFFDHYKRSIRNDATLTECEMSGRGFDKILASDNPSLKGKLLWLEVPDKNKEIDVEVMAGKNWEEANNFFYKQGGVNPTPFIMGFKSGVNAILELKKDKLYSLEDIRKIKEIANLFSHDRSRMNENIENYISSLHTLPSSVEIEWIDKAKGFDIPNWELPIINKLIDGVDTECLKVAIWIY